MSALILIVEDERDLVDNLEYNLQREGFRTRGALDGASAIAALQEDVPDLVLLDLMLPDTSGMDICRAIRQSERTKHVPVLILSAKGEEIDRVVGFEVGADDYVVKPFSVRELLLRVKAILRRAEPEPVTDESEPKSLGRLRVDVDSHRAWVDESEVSLTALEFRLLNAFIERQGRVQTRNTLLRDVWGIEADVTTRTVDTHVKRLRQKLGAAGNYIETLRGVGYRLKAQIEHELA